MNTAVKQIIPWTLLLLPFLILASFYTGLPDNILIARDLDGSDAIHVPKSLFTVFRVPLIEIVCALAIEVMRRRFAQSAKHGRYYLMWTVLLYTVALKSVFQAFEISASDRLATLFLYSTVGVVALGIILAIVVGSKAFVGFDRGDWKISVPEILMLVALLLAYILLALVPVYVFG